MRLQLTRGPSSSLDFLANLVNLRSMEPDEWRRKPRLSIVCIRTIRFSFEAIERTRTFFFPIVLGPILRVMQVLEPGLADAEESSEIAPRFVGYADGP